MDAKSKPVGRFNWKLIVVLLMGLVVLGGTLYGLRQWRRTYMATRSYEIGMKAYEARDWTAASRDLGRYISVHRQDVDATLKYADAQLHIQPQKIQNVQQAVNAYRRALTIEPGNPEAADRVSQIYLQLGIAGDAIPVLETRLAAADDPGARQILAMCLAMTGKIPEAAEQFRKVIADYPGSIAAYQRLAELMRSRPEEVLGSPLEVLRSAVARNPQSADAHIALAAYLQRSSASQDARDEAAREIDVARSLDLANPSTRVALAARLLDLGDFKGAVDQLESAAAADDKLLALWSVYAAVAKASNATETAAEVAERGLRSLADQSYVFMPTAIDLYIFAGKNDKAGETLNAIREADPKRPDIPYFQGLIARASGDYREAVKCWQVAAAADTTSPQVRMALAQAYEAVGDLPASVRELRILAGRFPTAPDVRLALARTLAKQGGWREAALQSAEALKLNGASMEARVIDLNVRAHVAVSEQSGADVWKQIDSELAALRKAAPDSRMISLLAADISQLRGDTAETRQLAASLQADPDTRRQGLLLEAQLLYSDGRTDEAVALVRRVIDDYPKSSEPVEFLADLLTRLGSDTEALAVVTAAVSRVDLSDVPRLRMLLAGLYRRSGNVKEAQRILRDLAASDPSDVSSRFMLISLLDESGITEAEKLVGEIKAIEGEDGFRWKYQQARIWLASPEWKTHLADITGLLESNIRTDPRDLYSLILLGVAEEKAGRLNLAVEAYRKAYLQEPSAPEVVFYLVNALQRSNNLDDAGKILDEAARRGVDKKSLSGLKLGQQVRLGQVGQAIATTEEMLAVEPDNTSLNIFLANLKMRQKDFAGARTILDGLDASDTAVAMARVDLLLREGKVDEAMTVCNRFVEKDASVGAYFFRGRLLAALGRLDQAQADYEKIASIEPDNPRSWMLLADFFAARKMTAKAVEAIEKALKLDSNNPATALRAVRLYSQSDDPAVRASADTLLEKTLAANPGDADLNIFKARRLISRATEESLAAARTILTGVTLRDPASVEAWSLLAQAALFEGQPDSALEAISRAMAGDPDDTQKRLLLLQKAAAERVRWPALAVTTLKSLWDENPGDIAAGLALASAYRETNDYDKAVSMIDRMLDVAAARDVVALELAAADVLLLQGKTDEAIARVEKAAAASPDDPKPSISLASMLAGAGRIEEAKAAVIAWHKAHPDDARTLVLAAEAMLEVAASVSDDPSINLRNQAVQNAALVILESALATFPDEFRVRLAVGAAQQSLGNNEKAEVKYREILATSPDNPVALNNLAWLLDDGGSRLAEALRLADRGRAKYPEFVELIDTRGVIYRRLGRLDDAERELREAIRLSPVNSRNLATARLHLGEVLVDKGMTQAAVEMLKASLIRSRTMPGLAAEDRQRALALVTQLTGQTVVPQQNGVGCLWRHRRAGVAGQFFMLRLPHRARGVSSRRRRPTSSQVPRHTTCVGRPQTFRPRLCTTP